MRVNSLDLIEMLPKLSSDPQRYLVFPVQKLAITGLKHLGTPKCAGQVKTCTFKLWMMLKRWQKEENTSTAIASVLSSSFHIQWS